MKKTAVFLCSFSLMFGLPVIAHKNQNNQVIVASEQLTPELWDQQHFASLTNEQKQEVIRNLKATQGCFQNIYESMDKGAEAFLESFGLLVQIYSQMSMNFVPRVGMVCLHLEPVIRDIENNLPMMKALEILPSAENIYKSATRFLVSKDNMTEQDLKRALNKAFRNKETKVEIKAIVKKHCDYLTKYLDYINTHYAQEVAELTELIKMQMQEFLSKMQEQ